MASNTLPQGIEALFTLAEDMADGLNAHETAVGVKQNTQTAVRAALSDAQTKQSAFLAARSAQKSLTAAQTVADSNAKAFIAAARSVLATYLGAGWSQAWVATGFPNQSTAVPSTMAERQALLASLQAYFTANPSQENAPLNVTAARAGTLFTALSDARSAVNAGLVDAGQKKAARDASETALRRRMRGLVDELTQLVAEDDPRWYAFGLNPPAAPDTPDVPDGLVLTAGEAGTVLADWADAARAEHYRVFKQVVGTDPDFVAVAMVNDSDATLSGLPSGGTVRVRVTAVNEAGESLPSESAEMVVP